MSFHDEETEAGKDAYIVDHDQVVDVDGAFEASDTVSRTRFRWFKRGKVALITDAHRSPIENLHHRETLYKWLQGSRVPFLLASGVTYIWMHNIFLSVVLFCISIPLPWIAVVVANGVGEPKDPRTPSVYKPALARMNLETGPQLRSAQSLSIEVGAPLASEAATGATGTPPRGSDVTVTTGDDSLLTDAHGQHAPKDGSGLQDSPPSGTIENEIIDHKAGTSGNAENP